MQNIKDNDLRKRIPQPGFLAKTNSKLSALTYNKNPSNSTFTYLRTDHDIVFRHIKISQGSEQSGNYICIAKNANLKCARCENYLSNCTCIEFIKKPKNSHIVQETNSKNSVDNTPLESIEEVTGEEYELFEIPEESIIYEAIEELEEVDEEEEWVYQDKTNKMQQENSKPNFEQNNQKLLRKFLAKSERKSSSKESSKPKKQKSDTIELEKIPQLQDEKSIFELKNSTINTQKHFESKAVIKPNIYSMLRLAFEQNLSPTVRIQIKNVYIDCHMMVLQSYSDFFAKCGNAQLIVLPAQCVSASSFRMFYAWCLSGNPMISVSTIVNLMKTAMYLRVSVLVDICFQHLYDDLFSEDVAFFVYIKAHNAGLSFVAHLMLTRIGRFFLPMVACQEFLYLDAREMLELLDADLIGVHTEAEVLFSLVRWSCHDWEKRERYMPRLVRKVRFGLMPVWYLYMLARGTGVNVLDRVLSTKGVKKFITDSIVFALKREEKNEARDELFKEIHLSKVPTFRERLWIMDEDAQRNGNYASLSYGDFLKYLKTLLSRDLSEFQKFSLGSSPKPRVNHASGHKHSKKPVVMFKKSCHIEESSEATSQQQVEVISSFPESSNNGQLLVRKETEMRVKKMKRKD